jgi:hypothetical protein
MGPRFTPHPDPWANFANQLFTLMATAALAEREKGSLVIKKEYLNHYSPRFWNRFIVEIPFTEDTPDITIVEASGSSPGPLPPVPSSANLVEVKGYWQSASTLPSPEVMWNLIHWPPKGLLHCDYFLKAALDASSIGVHLRRGDYLVDRNFITTANRNALLVDREINTWKAKGWKVLISTDDPRWGREKYPDSIIIDTGDFLTDFYVLSQCSRWFVGSSTYSWWAATLGSLDHPERTFETYYPVPWIINMQPFTEIAPDDWIPLSYP